MAKFTSKWSNLYDVDGNLLRKAPLKNYTVEEVEQLVDDLAKKVEANPDNNTYKVYLNNAVKYLRYMYENTKEGTDHLLKKMQEYIKQRPNNQTVMDEYVEPIEEVKNESNTEQPDPVSGVQGD